MSDTESTSGKATRKKYISFAPRRTRLDLHFKLR